MTFNAFFFLLVVLTFCWVSWMLVRYRYCGVMLFCFALFVLSGEWTWLALCLFWGNEWARFGNGRRA